MVCFSAFSYCTCTDNRVTAVDRGAEVPPYRFNLSAQRSDTRVTRVSSLGYTVGSYLDAWGWAAGDIALFNDIATESHHDMDAFVAGLLNAFPSMTSNQAFWFWEMIPEVEE